MFNSLTEALWCQETTSYDTQAFKSGYVYYLQDFWIIRKNDQVYVYEYDDKLVSQYHFVSDGNVCTLPGNKFYVRGYLYEINNEKTLQIRKHTLPLRIDHTIGENFCSMENGQCTILNPDGRVINQFKATVKNTLRVDSRYNSFLNDDGVLIYENTRIEFPCNFYTGDCFFEYDVDTHSFFAVSNVFYKIWDVRFPKLPFYDAYIRDFGWVDIFQNTFSYHDACHHYMYPDKPFTSLMTWDKREKLYNKIFNTLDIFTHEGTRYRFKIKNS